MYIFTLQYCFAEDFELRNTLIYNNICNIYKLRNVQKYLNLFKITKIIQK